MNLPARGRLNLCLAAPVSAKMPGVQRCNLVEPPSSLDKDSERNSFWLKLRRKPQNSTQFAALLAINTIRTSGNPNNKSINVCVGVRPKSSQLQNVPHQALCAPPPLVPFHQRENTLQKRIYRVATAATLTLGPSTRNDFKAVAKWLFRATHALARDVNRQPRPRWPSASLGRHGSSKHA